MNGMKSGGNYASGSYSQGVWTHCVLVGEQDVGYHFYVNGAKKYTMSFSGGLAYTDVHRSNIGIGMREDEVEPANAFFSVVRIYNRALSPAEVKTNYDWEKAKYGHAMATVWPPRGHCLFTASSSFLIASPSVHSD